MRKTRLGLLSIALFLFGCDSSSNDSGKVTIAPPQVAGDSAANTPSYAPGNSGAAGGGAFGNAPGAINPVGSEFAPNAFPSQPTDTRAPIIAAKAPPAISGGTLIIARDGVSAIAADPDRDRVSVVDLKNGKVVSEIALKTGDEPGRLAEDADGRIHVVLRGAGAVATLDLANGKVSARTSVCGAPRGIAYDAAADSLLVACLGGELVTLPAAGGKALRNVQLAIDLRDVVVQDGRVRVTQFKSASLLDVDDSGAMLTTSTPSVVHQQNPFFGLMPSAPQLRSFTPALARRAVALSGGRTLLLHEREMTDAVQVADPHDPASAANAPMAFPGASAYGGGDGCQSIVQTAVSIVDADGGIVQSTSLAGSVVAVDAAASADGTVIAIANAGGRDLGALEAGVFGPGPMILPPKGMLPVGVGGLPGQVFTSVDPNMPSGTVNLLSSSEPSFAPDGESSDGCASTPITVPGQPVSVAFTPDGSLIVQSREPAQLVLVRGDGMSTVALGGESRIDTGHELFHRDAGAGIACASCHGEGSEDGHVWTFSNSGPRRTQSINVGLEGTAPFHWDGDQKDLPTLMDTVFVGRMGGAPQATARIDALAGWLFKQQPPARLRAADDKAALRGKALFESAEVGCNGCHNGEKLTNNKTVDVGTGGMFQVPSLVGVAFRAPFIHNGCAATLQERFDPACGGGDKHGKTTQLSKADVNDLTAYLETL